MLGEKVGRGTIRGSLIAFSGVLAISSSDRWSTRRARRCGWARLRALSARLATPIIPPLRRKQAQGGAADGDRFFPKFDDGPRLLIAAPALKVASPGRPCGDGRVAAALATISLLVPLMGLCAGGGELSRAGGISAPFIWASLFGWLAFGAEAGSGDACRRGADRVRMRGGDALAPRGSGGGALTITVRLADAGDVPEILADGARARPL